MKQVIIKLPASSGSDKDIAFKNVVCGFRILPRDKGRSAFKLSYRVKLKMRTIFSKSPGVGTDKY